MLRLIKARSICMRLLTAFLLLVVPLVSEADQSIEASAGQADMDDHSIGHPRYLCVHIHHRLTADPLTENQTISGEFDQVLDIVGTRGTEDTKLALSYTISYLGQSMSASARVLQNLLELSVHYELPIVVHLDGVNYWGERPELWNWWDPDQPGYDPENVYNVEWYDWGPEYAVKIGWRNWGFQHRVLPAPNLASPEFRQAQKECLDILIPMIVDWYEGLPDDRKYLLGGVVLGWELSPYVQAYFYEGGNECLERPADDDPWGGVLESLPLGYAAATALGLQDEGVISEETIDTICRDYLEYVTECAIQNGLDGDKVITHTTMAGGKTRRGGGHSGSGAMVRGVYEEGIVPGWSFYGTLASAADVFLDELQGRPWAAIEFPPTGLSESFIESYFGYRNCRYINFFNWRETKNDDRSVAAIRTVLGLYDVGADWLGWTRSSGSGQIGEFVAIDSSREYEDFAFQLEVRHTQENNLTGIIARAQDESNYYYLGLDSVDQRLVLARVVDGSMTVISEARIDVRMNDWHSLKIEMRGSSVSCCFDGELVIEATDDMFLSGKAGFRMTQRAAGMRDLLIERY